MSVSGVIRAPFPWFGGKSRAASIIWQRFGPVRNYVEPFAGSLAVLLARPWPAKIETVNDADGLLANFWRALQSDPEGVARWADWPINEIDLHARHVWLTAQRAQITANLQADPEFFDAKVAGWWVWGISQWIGSGWCVKQEWKGRGHAARAPRGIGRPNPHLPNGGQGVHQKRPQMVNGGLGVHKLPKLRCGGNGVGDRMVCCACSDAGRGAVYDWLAAISDRLRHVRVCCGDWARVLTPSVTHKLSGDRTPCGVLLDPPYAVESGRDAQLYAEDAPAVSAAVREWAIANGPNPDLRIALCGYDGEHDMPADWECVAWKANGGYGNQKGETRGKKNAKRERIWFSPHCLQSGLFGR